MSGRMIFPYEELPEEERGEFAYQEVFAEPPDYMAMLAQLIADPPAFPGEPWFQSVYDGTLAQFGKVKAESKLVGCPVIVEFEDGRRSTGTITGVGDVKYEHGELLSYELTVQEFSRYSPPVVRKRVVQRASRGLRAPKPYVDPVAAAVTRVQKIFDEMRRESVW